MEKERIFYWVNDIHRLDRDKTQIFFNILSIFFPMDWAHTGSIKQMYKRNNWGGLYFKARGEIQWPLKDEQKRKQSTRIFSMIKNERLGIEDDQIPS